MKSVSTNMNIELSIIIPCLNEEKYIDGCLDSILRSDFNNKNLEIIIVDGISSDKTLDIIKTYQEKFNFIKLIKNEKKIVAVAMNLGIKLAQGKYIVRLDAHSEYPRNYFTKLLEWSKKLDADNVGAVCLTGSKSDTLAARAIRFVMSDKFGVGNSLFRVGVKEVIETDTVPFGFYKKEVFDKIGLYNEKLVRVQDLEINKRLKASGGKIYLVPDVECIYYPRETFSSFYENRFLTGKWIILAPYLTNTIGSISLRHLVPLIFLLSLIVSLVVDIYVFFVFIGIYSAILFFRALLMNKNILLLIHILFAYFTLHFSYGLGSLSGFFSIIKNKLLGKS